MAERVIVKTPDYILATEVTVAATGETIVRFRRYIESIGWAKMELYMTEQQYEQLIDCLLEHSARTIQNTR